MKHISLLTLLLLYLLGTSAQNLYNHPNAANIDNEQNSTAGWSGPADIDSEDDDPKLGNYSIKIESEDEGRHAQYSFEANPGTSYTIGIWAKRGQGSNPVFDEWEGFSGFQKKNITGQGWKEYIFTLTTTSNNPVIKVFASKNGSDDKSVYIDAVSIIANNQGGGNEIPTVPTNLNASNITTQSLLLTWSASSDNIGVAGYIIFMNSNQIGQVTGLNFQVTGLLPSTEYSFYVKAYDADDNISPASNNLIVSTLADDGGGSGGGDLNVYHEGNANLPTVNWQAFNFYSAGNTGIGTTPTEDFRLSVNGKIRAKEVIVESDWSDFVFEPGYYLPTLTEVEKHIHDFGHLKDIPSAKEVYENGVGVGEINKRLLQKIE